MISRFEPEFRRIEEEYGYGYVASSLKLDAFGYDYGFLRKIDVNSINDTEMYLIELACKAKSLLASKVKTAVGGDRIHYQALLAKINKVMKR